MPQINMSYFGRMTDAPGIRAAASPSGLRGARGPRSGIRGRERWDPEGGDYLNALANVSIKSASESFNHFAIRREIICANI